MRNPEVNKAQNRRERQNRKEKNAEKQARESTREALNEFVQDLPAEQPPTTQQLLAKQLIHYAFNVPHIIVNQVCKRNPSNLSHPSYNTRVYQLNYILLQLIKQKSFCYLLVSPQGVTRSASPTLLPDGVHFNAEGNHLLYHSYHDAIASYVLHLTHRHSNHNRFVSFSWPHPSRYAPY